MKQTFATEKEANDLLDTLQQEGRWHISARQTEDMLYEVQWLEKKKYTAHDGQEFDDECWVTRDGEMKLIQDIDAEHARNIIRMVIRKDRELREALYSSIQDLRNALEEQLGDSEAEAMPEENANRILH